MYEIQKNEDREFEVVQNITLIANEYFTGSHSKIAITDEFIIGTSADSEDPGIFFYDYEWNLVTQFALARQDESPYNLEVYHVPELETIQVYVAGKETISIIELVKNEDGENFFKMTKNAFKSLDEQEYSSD